MKTETKIDLEFIIDNFYKLTTLEIANHLNTSVSTVKRRAYELGLKKEQKYNVDFFKIWSHDMAYILGFIFADGCIQLRNNSSWSLTFGQNSKDKSVLEFISKKLGADLKIKDTARLDKRTNKVYTTSRLEIHSKKMILDLISLNVCRNKTGNEKLPEIPEEFKFSFLCGYHDGDGHFLLYKQKVYAFIFGCMNKQFLLDIQKKICGGIGSVYQSKNFFLYRIGKKATCLELDRKMIENVSFYLKRKHSDR